MNDWADLAAAIVVMLAITSIITVILYAIGLIANRRNDNYNG